MRLIDADTIVNYRIKGNFTCGELSGSDQFILLPVATLGEIPTAKDYFSDEEYRILLSALVRERKVCEKVDKDCGDNHKLIHIMNGIEKKIYNLQYGTGD